jgi:NADPH:quinone reductase-like Zn-dependent oxidoreductase
MLDNVGNRSPSACRRVLAPKAIYVASFGQVEHRWLGPLAQLVRTYALSAFVGQKMTLLTAKRTQEALVTLNGLIGSGKVMPVIDRTYPLSQTAEAMRYLEQGHVRGKVVITV